MSLLCMTAGNNLAHKCAKFLWDNLLPLHDTGRLSQIAAKHSNLLQNALTTVVRERLTSFQHARWADVISLGYTSCTCISGNSHVIHQHSRSHPFPYCSNLMPFWTPTWSTRRPTSACVHSLVHTLVRTRAHTRAHAHVHAHAHTRTHAHERACARMHAYTFLHLLHFPAHCSQCIMQVHHTAHFLPSHVCFPHANLCQ